jgi:hypothetical protein
VHNRWKTVVGFALLGLAIAAISYAYAASCDYAKPMNGLMLATTTVSVILCPPQLLFASCIDCEVIGRGGFIMYSIIGVLNAALYAAIGFVVAGLRKKSDRQL